MKHLIETTDSSSLPITRYDRLILDSTTNEIVCKGGGYEYVDLGLPSGLKWAKCNIGAETETDYGDYFQWGETTPDTDYTWATYKYCNGSETTITKYCTRSSYGTVDNKTTLDLEDDAARANMGGVWRMPTSTEFQELYDNTDHVWITNYNGSGVNGTKFTSKTNGNSIFFPASGYANGTRVNDRGSRGGFWSSSLHPSVSYYGLRLHLYSGGVVPQDYSGRIYGFCVRSVCM